MQEVNVIICDKKQIDPSAFHMNFMKLGHFMLNRQFHDLRVKSCEPVHEIYNNVVCATSKASDQPAHMRSLIRAFASRLSILIMIVKLLTEHHLEFLSLKGGCRGSSESTHVKMPHC